MEEQIEQTGEEITAYYQWVTTERPKYERTRVWYLFVISIAVLVLIYSIYTTNFLFAVMVFLVAFILILQNIMPNKELPVIIAAEGVVIGEKLYPWRSLSAFYIIYEPPRVTRLYFENKSGGIDLSIDLHGENPLEVRELLLNILPEDLDMEDETRVDYYRRIFKV